MEILAKSKNKIGPHKDKGRRIAPFYRIAEIHFPAQGGSKYLLMQPLLFRSAKRTRFE
jgi:hypothetical protein